MPAYFASFFAKNNNSKISDRIGKFADIFAIANLDCCNIDTKFLTVAGKL